MISRPMHQLRANLDDPRVSLREQKIIRGYRVTVTWLKTGPVKAEAIQRIIATIIAQSIMQGRARRNGNTSSPA